jgi:hypothetical protein
MNINRGQIFDNTSVEIYKAVAVHVVEPAKKKKITPGFIVVTLAQ